MFVIAWSLFRHPYVPYAIVHSSCKRKVIIYILERHVVSMAKPCMPIKIIIPVIYLLLLLYKIFVRFIPP